MYHKKIATVIGLGVILAPLFFAFAQDDGVAELTVTCSSVVSPLPKALRPNLDLSGRGLHAQKSWPQGVASSEAIERWAGDVGFTHGLFRMQYNLWEIEERLKDKTAGEELRANYENIIKRVNDGGGTVLLTLFGTPPGMGKVLDPKSPPVDLKGFKAFVKDIIRYYSCEKKYAVWYEVWSAPDLDDFFLGRRSEYLALYRVVAQAVQELEDETKIHIPVGGPGVSWWFQNIDGNTISYPERSLMYELIRYTAHNRLPLDFITWHAYTSDPSVENSMTIYRKPTVGLIRTWLRYFHLDPDLPLIVDEWNFDNGLSNAPERGERSFVSASFIPARAIAMNDAGVDAGVFYCLEDFKNNTQGVVRNVGVLSFDSDEKYYKGEGKASLNAFWMMRALGNDVLATNETNARDFLSCIATKDKERIVILVANYIDPDIVRSVLSRNIGLLNEAEKRILLRMIKNKKVDALIRGEVTMQSLHPTRRIRAALEQAMHANQEALHWRDTPRPFSVLLKNLTGSYTYQRYALDSSCNKQCPFAPAEERAVESTGELKESLSLDPYSVNLIVLTPKPAEAPAVIPSGTQPASS